MFARWRRPPFPGITAAEGQGSVFEEMDRRHASATLRNRVPILEVLRSLLPTSGLVIEVASGTGEHAEFLDLRGRDPRWGLRNLDEVTDRAADGGLIRERVLEMPANNLSVVFRKA